MREETSVTVLGYSTATAVLYGCVEIQHCDSGIVRLCWDTALRQRYCAAVLRYSTTTVVLYDCVEIQHYNSGIVRLC
jgi:hypothetical protein